MIGQYRDMKYIPSSVSTDKLKYDIFIGYLVFGPNLEAASFIIHSYQ